tara:strand:+ start:202 stop:660 length:459 start_codon:yes stop_codon:yes gene_type:complete
MGKWVTQKHKISSDESEILKYIRKSSFSPINKNLSQMILAILCDKRKKIGVFKQISVADIRDIIFSTEDNDFIGFDNKGFKNKRDEQDLFIRIELYKLKNKGYVKFHPYRKRNYNVQSNIKGLEFCISLLMDSYKELTADGKLKIIVDENIE